MTHPHSSMDECGWVVSHMSESCPCECVMSRTPIAYTQRERRKKERRKRRLSSSLTHIISPVKILHGESVGSDDDITAGCGRCWCGCRSCNARHWIRYLDAGAVLLLIEQQHTFTKDQSWNFATHANLSQHMCMMSPRVQSHTTRIRKSWVCTILWLK